MTEKERLTGTVCWFDAKKGIGFIKPDEGENDYFVHWTNIEMEGFKSIKQDQKVSFVLGSNHKGTQAEEVLVEE